MEKPKTVLWGRICELLSGCAGGIRKFWVDLMKVLSSRRVRREIGNQKPRILDLALLFSSLVI